MVSERDAVPGEAEARASLLERLRGTSRPGGYDPGDRVHARLKDAEGNEHATEFEILSFCGGGFAGQVYRSRCVATEGGPVAVGQLVALKFFSPRSGMRRLFRDILYRICFLTPFAYQYNEASVRAGLPLTRLLQIVCQATMGSARPINEFYGTFWDEHVGSYAEVNEWVTGGVTDPVPDDGILLRRAHNRRTRQAMRQGAASEADLQQARDEMSLKRRFMGQLCILCRELGLDDLLRQVYWWTGASQPNVLTRRDGSEPAGEPDFVWVDRRPGLPGLLLSLGDFVLLAQALFRGSIPPFDRIRFRKLRAWAKAPDREEWNRLVDRLEADDRAYRRTQVDWSSHGLRIVWDRSLHRDIAAGVVDYWRKTGRVDAATAERLERSPVRFTGHVFISLIPFLGRRLQKWMGNEAYRQHVSRFLRDGSYRWSYFDHARAGAVKVWVIDGRTTSRRAEKCLGSFPCYFTDAILCGWMPPVWQRFVTDLAYQLDRWRRFFTSPFKYIFVGKYRRDVNIDWIRSRTAEDAKRGMISQADADEFVRVAGDKSIQQYITGLIFVATMRSEWIYLILAYFGLRIAHSGHASLAHLSLAQKVTAIAVLLLVSPGGILRLIFCIVMGLTNRDVPYTTAAIMSPIRAVGDLAFPAQMAKTHPRFSAYLLTSTTCRLAEHVPVFGERGGLLSLIVVTVVLSWPASLKAWWRARRAGATA